MARAENPLDSAPSGAEVAAAVSAAAMFSQFLQNLSIKNSSTISLRYGEITSALNKGFRDTESKTANTLRVGSFGRATGINGISDLDMLYFVPKTDWEKYKNGGQRKLLQDARAAIDKRYPNTKTRVDRLVVTITFTDFHIEAQPVFEQDDGSFQYPDTKNGGTWKTTKPREEMQAVSDLDAAKNQNLRHLCKMVRAWKNKHGVVMGGLLIDTLAYNFLAGTTAHDSTSYSDYGKMCRDFFDYLANQPKQERYAAPGSNQHVRVKKPFQRKAKKARELCDKAISAAGQASENDRWKQVFGRPFPAAAKAVTETAKAASVRYRDTEEFIEDLFPVDIRYSISLDCDVKQSGFREYSLREMLRLSMFLKPSKTLDFRVSDSDVPGEYKVRWKVLNQGPEAERRDEIRGQILIDDGHMRRTERTSFRGDHIVECYAIKDGVVVARDAILVPIRVEQT